MIKELREIGRVNDAAVLIIQLDVEEKEWVGLAYKNNLKHLSICFWSARDEQRMATTELVSAITERVATLTSSSAADLALFDVQYEQPQGWDRWLGGVPRPVRSFFDSVLHPKLKAKLETVR